MADESIWKKEISFGRKRKEPVEDASTEQDATGDATGDEATSVWKKELSFGRKKKAAEAVTPSDDADSSGDVQGSEPEPGPAAEPQASEPEPAPEPDAPAEAEPASAPEAAAPEAETTATEPEQTKEDS